MYTTECIKGRGIYTTVLRFRDNRSVLIQPSIEDVIISSSYEDLESLTCSYPRTVFHHTASRYPFCHFYISFFLLQIIPLSSSFFLFSLFTYVTILLFSFSTLFFFTFFFYSLSQTSLNVKNVRTRCENKSRSDK